MDFWEWGLYNVPMKRGDADDCRIHGIRVAGAGVMTDLLRRRVPNQLVLLGLITGCYLCICRDGIPMGISLFLKDAFWPTLLLFPFYLLGQSEPEM